MVETQTKNELDRNSTHGRENGRLIDTLANKGKKPYFCIVRNYYCAVLIYCLPSTGVISMAHDFLNLTTVLCF